jgi:diguanylate cyclase (GGDEF)-like protein
MKRLFLLFLMIATLALPAAAQQDRGWQAAFSLLSYRDGLSNTSVSSIVQDSRGFMWFGTQNGLNRYDGKDFKLYENEPFSGNTLSQNLIQTLFMDANDILWIGTYGGLNRFDLKTERFSVFRNVPADDASLSGDLVIAITRDAKGRLWVGTSNGLNRMNEKDGTFKRYLNDPKAPGSLPNNTVRALCCDSAGRLWVGTAGGGFCRFVEETDSFETIAFRPGDPSGLPVDTAGTAVMSIIPAPEGKLWVGSWGNAKTRGGVSLFAPETRAFKTWALPDERVYVLGALSPGKIYAGTWGGGLYELDPRTGDIQTYKRNGARDGLPHDVVYSLFKDDSDVLWIGTNGGGIAKISTISSSFKVFVSDAKDPQTLAMGKITSILVDSSGTLWAGVYNGGVNRYDPATGAWRRYVRDAKDPASISNDIVNVLYEDSRGLFWAGTNAGLCLMDRERGSFTSILPDEKDPSSIASALINTILEDPKGNLWIGTIDRGLDYYDRASGKYAHYMNDPKDPGSLSDNLVYKLSYDAQGRLWVATNKGLNRMEGGSFKRYLYDPANKKGLSSNSILTLLHDSRGRFWIGSKGGGVMRYLPETDSFNSATKKEGLPGNTVYGILEGKDGLIWIITQNGVATYDPATDGYKRVSALNNLYDNSLTSGCAATADGTIYFSSTGAIFGYNPGKAAEESPKPPVFVTEVIAANDEKLVSPISSNAKPIRLRYWENSIELRFAALHYANPQSNQFAFKLEGFDKDWTYCGSTNTAKYTNLPGKSYTFRVKAANSLGAWNEEGASVRLKIETPLWLSPWAYAFYLVIVVLIGYLLASLRDKAVLKRKVEELSDTKNALESANGKLKELSSSDPLTGLANRRALDLELASAWSFAIRAAMPISGLIIDIDHFKKFNDVYGHQAGDDCIKKVTHAMGSQLDRDTDIIARYGGDEFFLFLPSTESPGARLIAERILKAVRDLKIPSADSEPCGYVTVSIGCATHFPIPGDRSESLIAKADEALYRAKETGRNRCSE